MLHVAIPFFEGDRKQAEDLLEWIGELGGVAEFDCTLAVEDGTQYAKAQKLAVSAFRSVSVLVIPQITIPDGWNPWPVAPNTMFERTAYHMFERGVAFLFLEPDALPTRASWLRELDASYQAHGMPFMGAVRDWKAGQHADSAPPTEGMHMVGMGIYPADFYPKSDMVRYLHCNTAFDVVLQGETVYRRGCYDSALFSHHWGTRNWRLEDGEIKLDKDHPNSICDPVDLRIPALIHGCKDDSLLRILRAQRQPHGQPSAPATEPAAAAKAKSPEAPREKRKYTRRKQAKELTHA